MLGTRFDVEIIRKTADNKKGKTQQQKNNGLKKC